MVSSCSRNPLHVLTQVAVMASSPSQPRSPLSLSVTSDPVVNSLLRLKSASMPSVEATRRRRRDQWEFENTDSTDERLSESDNDSDNDINCSRVRKESSSALPSISKRLRRDSCLEETRLPSFSSLPYPSSSSSSTSSSPLFRSNPAEGTTTRFGMPSPAWSSPNISISSDFPSPMSPVSMNSSPVMHGKSSKSSIGSRIQRSSSVSNFCATSSTTVSESCTMFCESAQVAINEHFSRALGSGWRKDSILNHDGSRIFDSR